MGVRPFEKDKPQEVVSGFRLRRSYPIKRKKSTSIREVKEVREMRDDRPPCPLIQLSQDKESRSGATPTTLNLGSLSALGGPAKKGVGVLQVRLRRKAKSPGIFI